ncbi:MAG TPA: type II CRISPR RNA-guided endonuclease Cas9 [Bacteroidales bacterium]|nr:CRISPR-associated protein Cas9 [uncultured bacterium]OFY23860.1 MAG: type II CRISPR RNA-guided endonuclease Cas9 [Bacteroidetes bacterium GWF2_33_38]HBF87554.1 type II CRISPR RNA-guided endonuclease Cas9 [Bacteroidales bacterium]
MKKILGLDLGTNSIGWALVSENENKKEIIGMGSRIIPLSSDDKTEFSSGNTISKNQKRTEKRGQRRGYDRYQLRREALTAELKKNNMLPDENLIKLKPLELWGLREKAVNEQITLNEFGRVLYHLNQKRGYKSSRSDANLDKKDTDYVKEVKGRFEDINEQGITIGQKFYAELQKNEYYRIKQQVFPREAYIKEFEKICEQQQIYYPYIITNEFVRHLKDDVIYYQRKLKSQKGLVSICEFEGFYTKTKEGKEIFAGPKVAPKSSPLFQVCKIWETINTITLKNKKGEIFFISIEKKNEIFEYLDNNEKLTQVRLFEILELDKNDGWSGNKQTAKGLQGNITKALILNAIKSSKFDEQHIQFNLTVDDLDKECYLVDRKTGEILETKVKKTIKPNIEELPLYKLWHTIYSISDDLDCVNTLIEKFKINKETAENLAKIDFVKFGFGNKSVKSMRKILPYLMDGYVYSDACSFAGYNHSNSITNDENLKRKLLNAIPNLSKNSLRQPVVEKILNQTINLVNEIIDEKRGWITRQERLNNKFEIRVELSRELKQSKDERNDTSIAMEANKKINEEVTNRLKGLNIRTSKRNIEKYKFIFPIRTLYNKDGRFDKKSFENAQAFKQCIYCGESFSITEAINGDNFDVDHIIPKSLLFDDSQTNRVLVHRKCNADDKKNKTAYDFIRAKGDEELNKYLERLENWYKKGILSYSKLERLKVSNEDYVDRKRKGKETDSDKKLWENFTERQLRETQYISRKSKEILEQVCYNVWSTSGSVTEHLRRIWGWDDVLMNLQLSKYRDLSDMIYTDEWETNDGQIHKKEKIKNWSKRDDHRHHAIDALAIACTQQGFVQRINTLSSQQNRDEMYAEIEKQGKEFKEKLNLLDKYLILQKPFTTNQIEKNASEILVSFKAGKRVATIGKRKVKKNGKKEVVQTGIIIPRGQLSEESVYGKVKTIATDLKTNKIIKYTPKYLFENSHLIFNPKIKELVEKRLTRFENDSKKAISSLKNEPIYLDENKTIVLQYGTCFRDEIVIKYPLGTGQGMLFNGKENELTANKVLESIVDKGVRDKIKARIFINGTFIGTKEAFKDLEKNPVLHNDEKRIPIKSVRCLTGLSAVASIKKDENGKEIGFVKPGNNHHIAIYIDENGKKQEHSCSFWHAVERKKYGIPVIIKNPKDIWDKILLNKNEYPNSFLEKIPNDKWLFNMSLQQNEMFILEMKDDDFEKAIKENDKKTINQYLYLVWSIAENDYWFRHHLETKNSELKKIEGAVQSKRYYRKSLVALEKLNPKKIRINNLGEITSIGEY